MAVTRKVERKRLRRKESCMMTYGMMRRRRREARKKELIYASGLWCFGDKKVHHAHQPRTKTNTEESKLQSLSPILASTTDFASFPIGCARALGGKVGQTGRTWKKWHKAQYREGYRLRSKKVGYPESRHCIRS